jgi:hypothetical protein
MVDNSYRVIRRGKDDFDVEMAKPGGRLKTVPGFRSEHEANAWIVQAKRMIRDAGPWTPLVPRKPTARVLAESPLAASGAQIEQRGAHDSGEDATTGRTSVKPARERSAAKP